MKKLIFTLTLVMLCILANSQDRILTHKGDTIICKVTEIGDKTVKYKYEGEDLTNSISKNLIAEVKFANGRIQKVTEKIIISSADDWEKVVITNVQSDVEGLIRVDEMMAKASSGWTFTNQGKMEKEAMDKLKKQAAARGCHIVLILTTTGKAGSYGVAGGTKASVTGVAYKY